MDQVVVTPSQSNGEETNVLGTNAGTNIMRNAFRVQLSLRTKQIFTNCSLLVLVAVTGGIVVLLSEYVRASQTKLTLQNKELNRLIMELASFSKKAKLLENALQSIQAKMENVGNKTSFYTEYPYKESAAAIHLHAFGNSLSVIPKGYPMQNWVKGSHIGSLKFTSAYKIVIAEPGMYFVYSQVQLMVDQHSQFDSNSIVCCILKNGNEVVVGSVYPTRNCQPTCTIQLSGAVELLPGETLSVELSQEAIIVNRRGATYFGAFCI